MSVEHLVATLDLTEKDIELLRDLVRADLAAFRGWVEYTYQDADEDFSDRKQRLETLQARLERRA